MFWLWLSVAFVLGVIAGVILVMIVFGGAAGDAVASGMKW